MSRIVDLDALEPEICKACAKTFCEFPCEPADCEILRVLRNAPTIEQPTWIPATDRLPTEEDATNFGLVLAVFEDGKADAWLWHTVAEEPERFEKWKPIFALL